EPSYNQNYDNYYPHESPSYPCCDYCGGSLETFQCQPDNQNVDFSGSDQTPQYPDINHPSPGISNEEIFQAKEDLMKSIQTFLERFNCIPFEEKPHILFKTWETFFAIQCSQPEDSNESFQKLLEDLKELAEYDKSTNKDRPIFLNDNEDHPVQNYDAINSKLLLINSNSQRLDKKEQEVKNVVEQRAERGNLSIQSLQNFRIVHKSFVSFDTSQISSIHSIAPILLTNEPKHLLSIGYEHLSITPETESDEVTKSNAENLLPILSKCEVTLEDKREFYDDDFENIEYIEASLSDPEIVSIEEENGVEEENVKIVSIEEENGVEEENVVQQEEEEVDFEDISQIQDVVLREKLLSITRLISNIESLNDNSTSDRENPSIPRPPPESLDAETDAGEEIAVVMNDKDKFDDDS
nr:hypothetical protein [Tanacetum cinerariifolium]